MMGDEGLFRADTRPQSPEEIAKVEKEEREFEEGLDEMLMTCPVCDSPEKDAFGFVCRDCGNTYSYEISTELPKED